MENLDPPSPPNQGWENGAFLPFAWLHPWFGGDRGLLFHFILSKIVGCQRLLMCGFRFRSFLYSERCAYICLAPSQNSNVWRPNIHVWTHFEPIFSLRVHGWIQTTVSQLAGVRGCRRKRQLSFLYNVLILMYRRPQLAIFGTAFSGELPQARTVLLFGSYCGQIFPRRNLLSRRRK